jgi:hypothetical protein
MRWFRSVFRFGDSRTISDERYRFIDISACLAAASLTSAVAVDVTGSLEYNFFLKGQQ